jgi:predicted RNA methylase
VTSTESTDVSQDPRHRLALASWGAIARDMSTAADQASVIFARGSSSLGSEAFEHVAQKTVPRWHFSMLNDAERNNALITAIKQNVTAGATVLDIGTGSGLLAMAAVRAGAAKVIACEMNPLLAEIARQVVGANGMSQAITVIGKPSTDLRIGEDLDAPVDVVMSEIVDCGLIGEGLLPSIRHAREHLLVPGGIMIPPAARLYGQLVHSESLVRLNQVSKADEFDLSLMNTVATRGHFPVRLNTWPHHLVSEVAPVLEFDLEHGDLAPGSRPVSLPVTADGEAHGLVVWFELDLGGGVTLSNSPDNSGSHWMQGLVSFDRPRPVKAGETAEFVLHWSDFRLSVSTGD